MLHIRLVALMTLLGLLALFSSSPVAFGSPLTVVGPGIYEDDDSILLYSPNWETVGDTNASGGTYHRSATADETVSLQIHDAASVSLVLARNAISGKVEITIDNTPIETFDLFARQDKYGVLAGPYNFAPDSTHTLTLRVTGKKRAASGDCANDSQWSAAEQIATETNSPALALDPNGNAHVAWQANGGAGYAIAYAAKSRGGGWSGATNVLFGQGGGDFPGTPIIGAGSANNVYVGLDDWTQSPQVMQLAHNDGSGWTTVLQTNAVASVSDRWGSVIVDALGLGQFVWSVGGCELMDGLFTPHPRQMGLHPRKITSHACKMSLQLHKTSSRTFWCSNPSRDSSWTPAQTPTAPSRLQT